MMKAAAITLGAVLALTCAPLAQAEEDNDLVGKDVIPGSFVGNVGGTSDYLFRGITQTRHDPAIQGSIEYDHPSGVYIGVWGSSIDFAGMNGTHAQLETDFYGGYRGSYNSLSYNIGAIGYYYVHTDGVNYAEATGSLGYDFGPLNVTGSVFYSPEYTFDSGDAVYVAGDIGVPIWKSLAAGFHVGHQSIDKNVNFGTPDYTDWGVALSAIVLGFNVRVEYHDTDLSTTDCFGGTDLCDAQGVVTVSRSF
jgi:uncharacterized protein (TIGR02001 family)